MTTLNKIRNKIALSLYIVNQKISNLNRYFMKDERSAKIFKASALATTAILSGNSYAEGGFAGMFNTATEQATSIQSNWVNVCYVIGTFLISGGIYAMYLKGKDENNRIKASMILIPMFAGAGLASVAFILDRTSETVGIETGNYGTLN